MIKEELQKIVDEHPTLFKALQHEDVNWIVDCKDYRGCP